ncbi:MAG: hypothetical protein ACREXY_24785 [Gammaproteobacteria bacterium]
MPDWVMDPWAVPHSVDDLANREAWRHAGHGIGELAADLEPAMCKRISETEYFCVAEIRAGDHHPAYQVEMTIYSPADGEPHVTDVRLRRR